MYFRRSKHRKYVFYLFAPQFYKFSTYEIIRISTFLYMMHKMKHIFLIENKNVPYLKYVEQQHSRFYYCVLHMCA
jgi:hypothetical protein